MVIVDSCDFPTTYNWCSATLSQPAMTELWDYGGMDSAPDLMLLSDWLGKKTELSWVVAVVTHTTGPNLY